MAKGTPPPEPDPTPPQTPPEDRWQRWDKRVRDAVLFIIGIIGVVNELFYEPEPRAGALIFLASILGIPFVLRADEKRRGS